VHFKIQILGSTSAAPTAIRFSTAQVLQVHERFFLIDCAEGTQILLRKYKIPFTKIDHIFISHLHGDHFYGIFGVISTFNLKGRKSDLHIYAPPNLEVIYNTMLKYTDFKTSFNVVFHPHNFSDKHLIYENNTLEIHSFPLKHRIETCGFLFTEKEALRSIKKEVIEFFRIPIKQIPLIKRGENFIAENGEIIENKQLTNPAPPPRSYAFCSDTAYYERIVPFIKNVDLLYHEATYDEKQKDVAGKRGHSTAKEAAQIAKLANAKRLIIGHLSARYTETDGILAEAREVFGNTDIAIDGKEYSIENKK